MARTMVLVCLSAFALLDARSASAATPARIAGPVVQVNGSFPIPDDNATGVTIDLVMSTPAAALQDVTIAITLTHTWVGDLEATLASPLGRRKLKLFGRPGIRRGSASGVGSDLNGTYTFDDYATNNLWTTLAPLSDAQTIPPGSYRTTTASRVPANTNAGESSSGGCSTFLSGAFGGVTPADAAGTWKLTVADRFNGDVGTITSVTLSANLPQQIYATGFENFGGSGPGGFGASPAIQNLGSSQTPIYGSTVRGSCQRAQFDFTGDGWSDFALVGPDEDDEAVWSIRENNGGAGVLRWTFSHGELTARHFADDFDGDGIADAALWSPSATALLSVRTSSSGYGDGFNIWFGRGSGVHDDPLQSGDYDGDRVADPAIFRLPELGYPDEEAILIVLPSEEGRAASEILATGRTGAENDFFALGGFDYTGDGIADLAFTENSLSSPGTAAWSVYDGATSGLTATFDLGLFTDLIVPGNYVGSTRPDFATVRTESGVRKFRFRDGDTAATSGPIDWGVTNDWIISGDYDGDGLDDLAVWRPSVMAGGSKFIVRKSTAIGVPYEVPHGNLADTPVAASRVH